MVLSNKLIYGKNGFLEKRITNDMGECVTTYTYNEAGFLTSDHQVGEYTEMGADKPEKVDVKNTYKIRALTTTATGPDARRYLLTTLKNRYA